MFCGYHILVSALPMNRFGVPVSDGWGTIKLSTSITSPIYYSVCW